MLEHIEEISFIASQLAREAETLETTGYPVIHWFLIKSLTKSLVKQAIKVNVIANTTLAEIAELLDELPDDKPAPENPVQSAYWTYVNDQAS